MNLYSCTRFALVVLWLACLPLDVGDRWFDPGFGHTSYYKISIRRSIKEEKQGLVGSESE